MSRSFVFRLQLLSFLALSPLAMAQVDTGTLSGLVKDPTGAVIQNAQVNIENPANGFTLRVQTNNDGFYSAPDLKVGVYQISAGAPGFQHVTKTGISLRVQDRIAIDFELPVGSAATSVSVSVETPPLQTETSSLGQVVDAAQIQNMPLNGRNYIQLATLGAGTSPANTGSERNTFYANGVREIQNSYLLDGIDNKNKIVGFDNSQAQSIEPVIDSVQEFKVQTSTFSAEFGQAAGALVNVTTKSGTNDLHGSLFEYIRNSYLDADPYFQPARTAKPQFIQNQYGATAGGRIIKDRTFYFFGWQGTRTLDAAPQLATVPTDSQKAGQFSTPIFDPATTVPSPNGKGYTRLPFPNNVIPASRFDPVSAKLMALYPEPNLPGKSNFFSNQRESISQDQFVARVDHRIGAKDSLFGRYSTTANTNLLPAPLPPPANSVINNTPEAHSFALSETHIYTPALIGESRVGYQESSETQQINTPRLFEDYGIAGVPYYKNVRGLPTFTPTGFATLGTAGLGVLPTASTGSNNVPLDKQGRTIQVNSNLSWVRGRHTFKFGFDFQQVTLYASSTLNARPSYSFNGVYTQNPMSRSNTGSPIADLLLGDSSSATVGTRSITENRQHIYQAYAQDDWKVTDKITINIGVRYELPLPFYETSNHYSNFINEPGSLYGTLLLADDAARYGYRRSFTNPNWSNFAPRLGLAYQLNSKTVIRAAGGVFFGRDENVPVASRPGANPPFYTTTTFTSDQIDPNIILSKGFPASATDPTAAVHPSVNSFLAHSPTPYVQEWNFTIQREIPAGFTAQIAYVGSNSHDLYAANNINQPAPGPGAVQPRRPLTAYSGINVYGPWVNAHFNSLQAQLERRYRSGLTLLAAYTYGHSLDNDNVSSRLNAFDLSLEKGSSVFDVRQRFVLSSVYELPLGKGKPFLNNSHIGDLILGGWQVSGILTKQTGLPFTPTENVDGTNTGTTQRPNRVAGGTLSGSSQSVQQWFDLSAFTIPAAYTFGNSGRNILVGPGQTNLDFGLSRIVNLTERFHLEFRAEAFNIFNTPHLGNPNTTLGTSTAGAITTAINPQRQIQFALKLGF